MPSPKLWHRFAKARLCRFFKRPKTGSRSSTKRAKKAGSPKNTQNSCRRNRRAGDCCSPPFVFKETYKALSYSVSSPRSDIVLLRNMSNQTSADWWLFFWKRKDEGCSHSRFAEGRNSSIVLFDYLFANREA